MSRHGDLPRVIDQMALRGQRVIWRFASSDAPTPPPKVEGSEFNAAIDPATFGEWDYYIAGGPGGYGSSDGPNPPPARSIIRFPDWDHAEKWLSEEHHVFAPGTSMWSDDLDDPDDPTVWHCTNCGAWAANGEYEHNEAMLHDR